MSEGRTRFDIAKILDDGRWTLYQILVMCMVAMVIILDGLDNQVLGFAVPLITSEWGVERADLAPVFALGFVAMAIGTFLGGWLGDRIGRRPSLLLCIVTFGTATGAASFADGVLGLGICRVIAGFGMGGAMPLAATLIAEFTPRHRRSIAVTIGIVSIPMGGVIGGFIAAEVLPVYGWRTLFLIGCGLPLAIAVLLYFVLPESPRFLLRSNKADADGTMAYIARLLGRMGHDVAPDTYFVDGQETDDAARAAIGALFTPKYRRDTLAMWVAFFAGLMTIYAIFNWAPSMLTEQGLAIDQASKSMAWHNIGGVLGALVCAIAMARLGSRTALLVSAAGSVIGAFALVVTPVDAGNTVGLVVLMAIFGAFLNAAQTGLYALAAQVYPTAIRATGVGATAGVGRLGAVAASYVGAAFAAISAGAYFGMLGVAMAVATVAIFAMKLHIAPVKGPGKH
ncbi:MAG: MFS transporter [Alphaproteobacteria bacterium]|nr:MAG: MFS transporter [Alphaproteobacteria bacterium]